MKRKFSDPNKDLSIKSPAYLPCEICSKKVFAFKLCTQPYTYCSQYCLEVLLLSQKNDYLDANDKNNSFAEMEVDKESVRSWDSWESINNPEEYAEMFHHAAELIEDIEEKK